MSHESVHVTHKTGVDSVAMDGNEKLVVIGNDVDATSITNKLRKKFCAASILTIEEVKDKEALEKEKEKKKKEEEEEEKKFCEEVLKRNKECRCWFKVLCGKPEECCTCRGEDKCCREKVCPPTYPITIYTTTSDDLQFSSRFLRR